MRKKPDKRFPARPVQINGEWWLILREDDPGAVVEVCTDLKELMRKPTPAELKKMSPAERPPVWRNGRPVPFSETVKANRRPAKQQRAKKKPSR